ARLPVPSHRALEERSDLVLYRPRAPPFQAYVERLTSVLGHQDRHGSLRAYVTGLCLPGERKSIEPMAARVDPRHVRARHQSMHPFIATAPAAEAAVRRAAT